MGRRLEALHPLIRAAGSGSLPDWAVMDDRRMEHSGRVARLMRKWAKRRGLRKSDRIRWSAAGYLHDALKGVPPRRLRRAYDLPRELPGPILHGPACAAELRAEGVDDPALLRAIAHHTTGHPELGMLGQSLYLADYLEPGRGAGRMKRQRLRSRLPDEHREVLATVAAAKIGSLLDRRLHIPDVTIEFWGEVVSGLQDRGK